MLLIVIMKLPSASFRCRDAIKFLATSLHDKSYIRHIFLLYKKKINKKFYWLSIIVHSKIIYKSIAQIILKTTYRLMLPFISFIIKITTSSFVSLTRMVNLDNLSKCSFFIRSVALSIKIFQSLVF
jgi:hypothetical protein